MKAHLKQLISEANNLVQGRNLAREYLQARILASLQGAGAMVPLAFHGGTALRFLFLLPRYSEDLDFALERRDQGYDFRTYLQSIRRDFRAEGYEIDFKVNDQKIVHSAFVRFPGLLYELDLSPHPTENIAVKLEVDTNPPADAVLTTTLIRRHTILNIQHHDKASLMAGKLHAVLARPYLKGRDIYDLLWYLSDPTWSQPNLPMLQNALRQSGWNSPEPTAETWRRLIWQRLESADWSQILADVQPFLEPHEQIALLSGDNLRHLLLDT